MGGIYVNDPAPRNRALELTGQPSLGSGLALGATAEESWVRSPFSPLRTQELMEATAGTEMPETGPVDQAIPPLFTAEPVTPRANLLTPKEANDRFGIPGELSWDQPVRAAQAQLQNRWKRDELKRQNILSRATPGVLPTAARLGVGFLVQAVDPLNVASAFIPVVGEARFAYLTGKLGRTGARLARGATEGFVGAAVVEPLVYLQAQSEQADYDAYDSILNLAFGTALGGGLHAGFGKLSDWIRGQPIELRETALRGAVAAVAEDRPVRVAEVMAPEPPRAARETVMIGERETYVRETMVDGKRQQVFSDTAIEEPGAERVTGAAVVVGDEVFVGRTHADAADLASERLGRDITDDAFDRNYDAGGFLTSKGRVVDRKEAARIAVEQKQAKVEGWSPEKTADLIAEQGEIFAEQMGPQGVPKPDTAAPTRALRAPQTSPARALDAQRATYQPTLEEAAQARALETQAEGWDQPITPETGAEEAAELIEATNEQVQAAKRAGDLTDQDMERIEGDPEIEKATKGRAAAYQAAASCLARVA